jgi:hypothetical protein
MGTYMMIDHDVERIDRIAIPLDTDVIFVREKAFTDYVDGRGVTIIKPELKSLRSRMTDAAFNIDEGKSVLKNLQIYEECLEELAKMLK